MIRRICSRLKRSIIVIATCAVALLLLSALLISETIAAENKRKAEDSSSIELSKLVIPAKHHASNSGLMLRKGEDVVALVSPVWDQVVAKHQDGLLDPKQKASGVSTVLSANEAIYHYNAALNGIVDSARLLLTFGVASSVAEIAGFAEIDPLANAILQNDAKQVESILATSGGEPDKFLEESTFDTTPVHFAVAVSKKGDCKVVELLLKHGANPSLRAKHGGTPLMIASALNRPEIAQTLLAYGARADESHSFAKTTSLHFAAEMGHGPVLIVLCEWLRNNSIQADSLRSATGGTPLHTAADSNRPHVLDVLVNICGCHINALLNGDSTPLYLAAQRGFVEVLLKLGDMGANLDYIMPRESEFSKERANKTRMGIAIAQTKGHENGSPATAYDYLNKNTEIGNGATALHAAVENGHPEAVNALLRMGAKQLDSMRGTSPLLTAIQYNHPDIALILMKDKSAESVKINAQSHVDGAFALFSAAGAGHTKVIDAILHQFGGHVNVNLKNNFGGSALSHAVYRGHLGIAMKLLSHQAERDAQVCQAGLGRLHDPMWFDFTLNTVAKHLSSSALTDCIRLLIAEETLSDASKAFVLAVVNDQSMSAKVDSLTMNDDGMNLLLTSARWGHVLVLELLSELLIDGQGKSRKPISQQEVANMRADQKLSNATILYLAAAENRVDVVKWLLAKGADYEKGALDGEKNEIPPMIVACEKGFDKIVDALIVKGDSVSRFIIRKENHENEETGPDTTRPSVNGIVMAAMNSQAEIVRRFTPKESGVEVLNTVVEYAPNLTPLLKAMYTSGVLPTIHPTKRLPALVRILLRQSNVKTAREHVDCVSSIQLLKQGWSAAGGENLAFSPLHAAIIAYADEEDEPLSERKALELVRELIAREDYRTLVREMLRKTAKTGFTPLALAVEAERVLIVKDILGALDHVNIQRLMLMKSGQDETLLDVARRLRNPELISILSRLTQQQTDEL